MRSFFGAVALLIGCLLMTGCSSVNSGCGGAGGYGGGCASGQLGKSLLAKGVSFPAFPRFDQVGYGASGAAVGTCASQACSGTGGGFAGGGLAGAGLAGAGLLGGGGGGCGLGGLGCGLGGAGQGLGGHGFGGGGLGQKVGGLLPFAGLRGASHPYGKQPPHTANASVGFQAPGGGQAPAYAYPYYTTRGPRDFLLDGCGPPPIPGYSPKRPCLPTIGY